MFSKKLKWYPIFESQQALDDLFIGKKAVVHRSMFGEALFVKNDGNYYAFKNKCPHQNKPLNDCALNEGHIVCAYHRYQFSLEDGKGHGMCLDKYQIKIEEGRVFLGKEVWSLF